MAFFKSSRPFVIAGPCSAETQEQVLAAARGIRAGGAHLFRAGVWKPRSRPGQFEGRGETALGWLADARTETGLPFAVEVAEPEHVELALCHNADVLWIGARTSVNPFQVQRLADALRGVPVPILVKNPVNPDVDLWLGGIERMEKAGVDEVAAVHRGFSGYGTSTFYRNQPNWPIPIELKRRRPDLPLFCDPSHITGNSERVAEIAQKAMDMHFDGLMIEVHSNPTLALTDAAQQITPHQLHELLQGLVIRQEFTHDMTGLEQLEYLRQVMDSVDSEIIDLLARRMELSEKIGEVKKICNMTVYQPARWREIIETRGARALANLLPPEFIVSLFEKIHDESIRRQLAVLDEKTKSQNPG